MASNGSLHWPPLPGGSGGAQAEVVTDVNMLPVNNFVSPATDQLKEVCDRMSQEINGKSRHAKSNSKTSGIAHFYAEK